MDAFSTIGLGVHKTHPRGGRDGMKITKETLWHSGIKYSCIN